MPLCDGWLALSESRPEVAWLRGMWEFVCLEVAAGDCRDDRALWGAGVGDRLGDGDFGHEHKLDGDAQLCKSPICSCCPFVHSNAAIHLLHHCTVDVTTTAYNMGNVPPIEVRHRLRIAREYAGLRAGRCTSYGTATPPVGTRERRTSARCRRRWGTPAWRRRSDILR